MAAIKAELIPLPVPGERVGDFGLEAAIGSGGMGAVFRAVDIKLDREVALKILPPDQAIDPEVVQRYYQEGRAAARLDHENIARVFSIGHDGRYHYIAFEYIEGTTIRQRVEAGGPIEVGDAINYTLQIANALVHSSSRGVVHRDIKPSNIIVTPQGRAKLVDMGLARRFERGQDTGLTQSGMTLGTFDYISPEQARDPRDVDVRGDLYSLGCTLFHMLSGRPPFPEGTVLQKLIQHQEEAPPDVRTLNPAVPDDLASILVKLMAKDRDRRYQTPELLIRDLLTVAGALGLRSINPEGLVWMAPAPRVAPAWTKQLVWGVPALAFLLIIGGMAWWGDGPIATPTVGPAVDASTIPSPQSQPRKVEIPARSKHREPAVAGALEYEVYASDDLSRMIAEASPGSTIILAERGPYEIQAGRSGAWAGLDLTILAKAGVRPLIRSPRDRSNPQNTPLLHFAGGRLTLEGIEFLIEGAEVPSAIRAEDNDLTVRRCTFRRPEISGSSLMAGPKLAAISVKVAPLTGPRGLGDRAGSVWVEASEFEGGQVALVAIGPMSVGIRDCTFGPTRSDQATFWAESPEPGPVAADFAINHVSVLAGAGPVFRILGTPPRIRVQDSAFGPPGEDSPSPTLVASDSADRLDWRGVDNVYGRFGAYWLPLRGASPRGSIRTFAAWTEPEDASPTRESGSTSIDGRFWEEADPIAAFAPGSSRPSRAFRIVLVPEAAHRPGARQGPAGLLPPPVVPVTTQLGGEPVKVRVSRPEGEPSRPREATSAAPTNPKPPAVEPDDRMKTMPLTLPTERSAREAEADGAGGAGAGESIPIPMPIEPDRTPAAPATTTSARPGLTAEPILIRSAEEFREALGRSSTGNRTLVIPADADWTVPACRVRGPSSLVIRADRGSRRPCLRVRPDLSGSAVDESGAPWILVRAGNLRLEGIDLVMASEAEGSPAPPAIRNRVMFAIEPGLAELNLVECSITIEGDHPPSAVVALLAGEPGGEGRIRFEDCLIGVGGDLVDVAGGRRLDLEVDNAVIVTGGSMLHAHGLAEGRKAEGLKLDVRQITARMVGGLVHLQAATGEPVLPVATILVRGSALTTGSPDKPLIRVDGLGDLEDLANLIRWEGRSVAYHQVVTYRRDQSARPGTPSMHYDRETWEIRVGDRDQFPIHGDLKFPSDWPAERHAWTLRRDDFRLPPEGPSVGADLRDIPNPPATR